MAIATINPRLDKYQNLPRPLRILKCRQKSGRAAEPISNAFRKLPLPDARE